MKAAMTLEEITSLPPEAQKQVRLEDEPFIGMWCERKDMRDSTAWVRNIRQCEWEA